MKNFIALPLALFFALCSAPTFADWKFIVLEPGIFWEYETDRIHRSGDVVDFWIRQSGEEIRKINLKNYGHLIEGYENKWIHGVNLWKVNCRNFTSVLVSTTDYGFDGLVLGKTATIYPPFDFKPILPDSLLEGTAKTICKLGKK